MPLRHVAPTEKDVSKRQVQFGCELIRRMRSYPSVNWSEVCRRAVEVALCALEKADGKKARRVADLAKRKVSGKGAPFAGLVASLAKRRTR